MKTGSFITGVLLVAVVVLVYSVITLASRANALEGENTALKKEAEQEETCPKIEVRKGDSPAVREAKSVLHRIRCIRVKLEYSDAIEKHAGLPRAWLLANVFGDRRDPNFKAFNDLPKHKLKLLLEALETYQHPGKDCENIDLTASP